MAQNCFVIPDAFVANANTISHKDGSRWRRKRSSSKREEGDRGGRLWAEDPATDTAVVALALKSGLKTFDEQTAKEIV